MSAGHSISTFLRSFDAPRPGYAADFAAKMRYIAATDAASRSWIFLCKLPNARHQGNMSV